MTERSPQPDEGSDFEQEPDTDEADTDLDAWVSEPVSVRVAVSAFADTDRETLENLIARVMHQDEQALAALYERLGGAVYSLALQITRHVGSAEEVLQDVFWQVWRQAPRFDSARGSVPAWVLTIARSRALDTARSLMRTPQAQASTSEEIDACLPSPDAGPQDLLFAAQQGSRLKAALQSLDPLRRQLVSLSFYRGLTQQDIADHTGLPLGTVKSHLRRSLATLREALDGDVAPMQG